MYDVVAAGDDLYVSGLFTHAGYEHRRVRGLVKMSIAGRVDDRFRSAVRGGASTALDLAGRYLLVQQDAPEQRLLDATTGSHVASPFPGRTLTAMTTSGGGVVGASLAERRLGGSSRFVLAVFARTGSST